jgi:hypothetical protein
MIISLLISSPFYIFWSRTFLIESTALFLATSSLACTLWGSRQPSVVRLAVIALMGSLAAVVKITTFLPFLVASVAVICYRVQDQRRLPKGSGWVRSGIVVIASVGIPALALVAWTGVVDYAKSHSILAERLMSTSLKPWTFGTLEQRLSAKTWVVFADRMTLPFGQQFSFIIASLGLILARRRLLEIAGCFLLYLVGIVIFTNLFYVHDYYYFANNIFLITAVGMILVAMIEHGQCLKNIAIMGLVLLLGSMIVDYNRTYRPMQAQNVLSRQRLGTIIRDRTAPDDIIILLGFDWSPEVPYYSQRRALCLPNWVDAAQVRKCLQTVEAYHIGAVIVLPPAQRPIPCIEVLALLREQGLQFAPLPVDPPFELLLRIGPTNARKGTLVENNGTKVFEVPIKACPFTQTTTFDP